MRPRSSPARAGHKHQCRRSVTSHRNVASFGGGFRSRNPSTMPGRANTGWAGLRCLRFARAFSLPCSRLTRVGAFSGSYFLSSLVTRSAVIWATTRPERGEST
jgi:hypothetical protein